MSLIGPTRVELRNLLGQVVRQAQFMSRSTSVSLPNLAHGLYQLTLLPAGQSALRRVVVVEQLTSAGVGCRLHPLSMQPFLLDYVCIFTNN